MKYLFNDVEGFNLNDWATADETTGRVHYSGHLHNNGGEDLTIEEYAAVKGWEKIVITDEKSFFERYDARQRELFLTGPKQISRADYWDALEVLPPENWQRDRIFEHFRMMEYTTGNITTQYARLMTDDGGHLFICKPIEVTDRTTWITIDDFNGLVELPESDD